MRSRSTALPWIILALCAMSDGVNAAQIAVTNTQGGERILSVSGVIAVEDSARFANAAAGQTVSAVLLASPGGSINAAVEIGKVIRRKGIATIVTGRSYCVSACGLIWLAGQRRLLAGKARVGFHTTYVVRNGNRIASAAGNEVVARYMSFLQLPSAAFQFATHAGPGTLNWLDETNRQQAGIQLEALERDVADAETVTAMLNRDPSPDISGS